MSGRKLGAVALATVLFGAVLLPMSPASAAPACTPTVTTQEISGASYQVASFAVGSCVWTVPDRVEEVDVLVVGAGGGGGGGAGYNATGSNNGGGGSGGGGGEVIVQNSVAVTPGEDASLVVGAGGANGAGGPRNNPGANGIDGEGSSFAVASIAAITAAGGAKGLGGLLDTPFQQDGGASGSGFAGGTATIALAGSGGSDAQAGSASLSPTPGTTLTFTGASVEFGAGGGGAANASWSADRVVNAAETRPGKGSGGGRGNVNSSTDYGYGNGNGGTTKAGDGLVVVRWLSVPADAPTNVSAQFVGDDVEITWTAPTFVGSAAITGYRVEVNDGNGWNALTSPVTSNTNTSYTATGLSRSGSYEFRVYAYSTTSLVYSPASALSPRLQLPPEPYSGPILSSSQQRVSEGDRVSVTGLRLGGVTRIEIDGKEAELLSTSGSAISFVVPRAVAVGIHDLVLFGDFGRLTQQDALEVLASVSNAPSFKAWTKNQLNGTVKLYAKNVVGAGKLQFFLNGEEVAWVRASSESDPKLRQANGSYYLVRTIELVAGQKNVIEIHVDGERLRRVAYSR